LLLHNVLLAKRGDVLLLTSQIGHFEIVLNLSENDVQHQKHVWHITKYGHLSRYLE